MSLWKLIVEDYGKIKSAEIEIAPLTLFVGDNNSGKSYLLALLWGIENFGVEALIGKKCVKTEEITTLIKWLCTQIDIVMEKKKHLVSLEPVSGILSQILNSELKRNKDSLVRRIFNSENVSIGKLAIELCDVSESNLYFEVNENATELKFSVNENHIMSFSKSIVEGGLLQKEEVLQWILVKCIYSGVLNIEWTETQTDRSIYLPAARTGFMLTKDIINKFGRKNTFNLSDEKEEITPFVRPINQFLDIMGDLSVEASGRMRNLELAMDIEKEMTNGTIEFSTIPNKEVLYVPAGYKKGISLRLASAVVTELSPLILILKHKDNVNRFFYEEPEMCLHPQLQCKMGKVIGKLVNSGIGMIITTHSDILLQHINNMIKLAKREDCKDICEKLGYTQLDLLSCSQVKVYQLRAKIRGKTEVEELLCGEDGFSVPTFNDALDSIMNEAYEIQG